MDDRSPRLHDRPSGHVDPGNSSQAGLGIVIVIAAALVTAVLLGWAAWHWW